MTHSKFARRSRRAILVLGVVVSAYAIDRLILNNPTFMVAAGDWYGCNGGQLYSGSRCVKKLDMFAGPPPCDNGWRAVGSRCEWGMQQP